MLYFFCTVSWVNKYNWNWGYFVISILSAPHNQIITALLKFSILLTALALSFNLVYALEDGLSVNTLPSGQKVVIKEDYDCLVKVDHGVESTLDYEQSNVLRYLFEDGSFVAIRPSGTEPKIKTYFTTLGKDVAEAQAQKDALADALKPIFS